MLLDLLYPPVCGICEKINKNYICRDCEKIIKKMQINRIEKVSNKYFDYQIRSYRYNGIIREKIIQYKFEEKSFLYKTFSKIILNNKKIYGFLENYDIILCVPMYITKKWQRGYNQSELIARKIAKSLQINFQKNNLLKIRETKKQSTLNKQERITNVINAFKIKDESKLKGKRVILFDDIYTTGNTVNECSRVLKQAGVSEIIILTIATD